MSEFNFKDGKEDGVLMVWHENGQKRGQFNYKNGKEDGVWAKWHENGQKAAEANFKDGEGVLGSVKFWNSKGEPVDSEEEAFAE